MPGSLIIDAIASLQAAVTDFLKVVGSGEFGVLSNAEFVDAAREVEAIRRQLATADYPIVAELEARDLADVRLTRDTAGCLQELWRISRHEAKQRVREADQLAPRAQLSGPALAPLRPHAAAARAAGVLSGEQTRIILDTLTALPTQLPVEQVDSAERILVDAAHALDPRDLKGVAQRLLDIINPDGKQPDERQIQQRRGLSTTVRADGTVTIAGTLAPVVGAKALAFFTARSAPRPDDPSGRDERSLAQRQHDAFDQLLDLALKAHEHADDTGAGVQVTVTIPAEVLTSGEGWVFTSLGQRLRLADALALTQSARLTWVLYNSRGGILDYGRSRRCASKAQIEALNARDGGCSFPGCHIPAEWSQRHHIKAWIDGGDTSLDNLVLVCAYHHARMLDQGWEIIIRNKVPWFIPPPLIDPEQKPLRNIRGLNSHSLST
jgi:hypothetical protein